MGEYRTLRAMREIADIPGAMAVMRLLKANGINHFECRDPNDYSHMMECCDIERMMDELESCINSKTPEGRERNTRRFVQQLRNFIGD